MRLTIGYGLSHIGICLLLDFGVQTWSNWNMFNKLRLFNSIKKHYFKCHNNLFSLGLSTQAISVYCYMLSVSEEYSPSIRELTKVFRVGRATIYRAINELLQANTIYIITNSDSLNKKSAIYAFRGADKWTKIVSDIDQKLDAFSDNDG